MTTPTTNQAYPPASQCVGIGRLLSPTVADLRRWTGENLPGGAATLPLLGVAYGAAVVGPWATPDQLQPSAQMAVWTYAFDDYLEREIIDVAELMTFLDRCADIVRTGQPDNSHPLLAALSVWQHNLSQLPGFPPLASLWADTFTRCLRGHRYDWIAGRAREKGCAAEVGLDLTVDEYVDHADSVSLSQVQVPRWIAYGGNQVPTTLDVLVPALDHVTVAVRLANDVASIERERAEPGQNNILMYDGVTKDWVLNELAKHLAALRQLTASLIDANFRPALNLTRLADWAVGTYLGGDVRDLIG